MLEKIKILEKKLKVSKLIKRHEDDDIYRYCDDIYRYCVFSPFQANISFLNSFKPEVF